MASRTTFGAKYLSPLLPLATFIVIVFDPLTNVPAGIFTSYTSPNPRYAPLVTPLLSILVGAPGTGPFQLFTEAEGLPPAKESVVPIRRVAAPTCDEDRLNVMVKGVLTPLNRAMGRESRLEEPTV